MTIDWNGKRAKELSKMSKSTLAQMHTDNGGLMGYRVYMQWTKDELINIILIDESYVGRNYE